MLYNKHNLAVAKLASKVSGVRPVLEGVFFTKDKTVATDSYRLLEISTPAQLVNSIPADQPLKLDDCPALKGFKPFIVNASYLEKNIKLLTNHQGSELAGALAVSHIFDNKVKMVYKPNQGASFETRFIPRIVDSFPDYGKLFPTKPAVAEITINGKMFAEMLEIVSKMAGEYTGVKIKFYGQFEPLVIEAETKNQRARGLMMPIKN